MPYRRLPNTDAGRIRAIQTALKQLQSQKDEHIFHEINVPLLQSELAEFERLYKHYNDALRMQVTASKKYQKLFKEAKLYISHFIQVLNLAVIRKEIKKELKPLYGLDIDSNLVPEMTSNEHILEWGERIISGENLRKLQGGAPLYNPSIARVNVLYSQFKEVCFSYKLYQETTNTHQEKLKTKRTEIDKRIQTLWNHIENHFAELNPDEHIKECKKWGVVYYLRKNERKVETNEYN
ncbi:MAG: hypothetical protein QM654_05560 [Dysgonamonadaceae bacterium]